MDHKIEYYRVINYRNSAVKDRCHKIARYNIKYCKEHRIGVIVVEYNKGWKNDVPLKRSNKIFQLLPHLLILEYIEYIGMLEGIDVIRTEESYTSMTSNLNLVDMDRLKRINKSFKKLKYFSNSKKDPKITIECYEMIQKLREILNRVKKGVRGVYITPKAKKFLDAEPYVSRGSYKSYKYGIIHLDVNGNLGIGRKADEIICEKYGLFRKPFESYIKNITKNGSYKRILNLIRINNIEEELFQLNTNNLSEMVPSSS
ncbi:MAG: hypothetical protein BAJALOKI2v1_290029 [Promethearchaeota archaeon]|nr:MAG: hypothetical protein BAJALOKI2v1_290029 [Candidatus Lokiarchaeota archaeon]